jgi:hypothetical protein
MSFDISTLFPALIGAISGSLGGASINDWYRRKALKKTLHENLINQYLLQLQDFAESLWYRLDNIKNKGGHRIMNDIYFEETTLYALGSVLAYARIFLLDGVYSQMEQVKSTLGTNVKNKLYAIDAALDVEFNVPFFRYERLALAEAVIRKDTTHHICSYLEFKKSYQDTSSNLKKSLEPAKIFISSLEGPEVASIMADLKKLVILIEDHTGIVSKLKNNVD